MRTMLWLRFVLVGLVAGSAGAAQIWTDIGGTIAKFDSANPSAITNVGVTHELPMDGMDFTTDGRLYGVADQELFLIDQADGSVDYIGIATLPSGQIFMDISWDPVAEKMYGIDSSYPSRLYEINLNTGAASLVGPLGIPFMTLSAGLATTAAGVRYVDDSVNDVLYRLAGLTGMSLGPAGFNFTLFGGMTIDWSRDGICYHAASSGMSGIAELWTINLSTGAGTYGGVIGAGNPLLSVAIKPVPEPGALAVLAVLAACGSRRRG